MAVNIKDLYGNPGYRFKKISIRRNSQWNNALPYLHGVFLLAVWLFSRSDAILAISFIPDLPLAILTLRNIVPHVTLIVSLGCLCWNGLYLWPLFILEGLVVIQLTFLDKSLCLKAGIARVEQGTCLEKSGQQNDSTVKGSLGLNFNEIVRVLRARAPKVDGALFWCASSNY